MLKQFIAAMSVGTECSDSERRLLSLPPRMVGLGIPIFSGTVHFEHTNLSPGSTIKDNPKPRILNFTLDIIFTTRRRRLNYNKTAILESFMNPLWMGTNMPLRNMCIQIKI